MKPATSHRTPPYKVRIRLGTSEFEGEGPIETVERHMEIFALMTKGEWPPEPQSAPASEPTQTKPVAASKPEPPKPIEMFHKIVLVSGPVLFIKVPAHLQDAIFLILLAQKMFKKNDAVSGLHLMRGIRRSGHKIPRIDYMLMKFVNSGLLDYSGNGRARRYTLTPKGQAHAEQLVPRHLPVDLN